MAYLVRKIRRPYLDRIKSAKVFSEIEADVVTSELRTQHNTLSTWRIERIDDVSEAILAIATSSTKIEKMDFIVIDEAAVFERGLKTINSKSYATPIECLQDMHYDIADLKVEGLGKITDIYKLMAEKDENKYVISLFKSDVKKLLSEALAQRRFIVDDANEQLREDLIKIAPP